MRQMYVELNARRTDWAGVAIAVFSVAAVCAAALWSLL